MDINHVIHALKSTTVAEGQSEASEYLKKVSSVIGFPQLLIRVIQNEQLDCAIRQAGVIYLKNLVSEHWVMDKDKGEGRDWELSEQDKILLRQQIIPTVINAPEPIKVHLSVIIQNIMRHDFPDKWTNLTDELFPLLSSEQSEVLSGVLLILHRLCKIYEYKRSKEKAPLVEFMCRTLPILQERLGTLVSNQTMIACFLQKQILKIFYCLVQFSLNTQMITIEEYVKWLKLFMEIAQRPVPVECEALPKDEQSETIWWKCKKWALKIIQRVFERYGNKGNVDKPYVLFAEDYSKTYALPVIESLLVHILNDYINQKFLSEHVLYLTLSHLSDALNQAQIWQVVKPKAEILVKNVIFPLLQHSSEDEEMWNDDEEEFLRYKYDVYEDLHQPSSAASTLLQMIAKRQGIMQKLLEFIMGNLTPNSNEYQVDGALHMIAVISAQLIKSKKYKKDVEMLIDAHITPRLLHESRFVRMRACYSIRYMSDAPFKNTKIIERIVHGLIRRLKEDTERPVRVEAAMAIQALLNDQNTAHGTLQILKPHLRDVLISVLKLVAETHVDDLPTVVDTLIENYEEEVIPIAYEVTVELVNIFNKMVTGADESEEDAMEDHSVGVMGILATLETILDMLEEHQEIIEKVEPVVRRCIVSIFECYCESYFEEALSLTHTLIVKHVSTEMWSVFDMICKAFQEEGTGFFADCMPVFYAYVTSGSEKFLGFPNRVHSLLTICEKTISDVECDESTKAHAAKMLEVFLLQYQNYVNELIPNVVQLVLAQLQKPFDESNSLGCFRPQLFMVVIAALYCDFQLCTNLFSQIQMDSQLNTFEWLIKEIYKGKDDFEGIHDRKMIIWFLCRLLSNGVVPNTFENQIDKLMGWILILFADLKRCIKELAERSKREEESDDEDEDSSGDERVNGELKDSDDDVDEENMEYLEALEEEQNRRRSQRRSRRKSSTNKSMEDPNLEPTLFDEFSESITDSEDYHHFQEETDLEAFATPLDGRDVNKPGLNVFVLFKRTLEFLKEHHPIIFTALCEQQQLGSERMIELKNLMDHCTLEENLEKSKHLAQSGGYIFDASQPVPNSFTLS